MKLIVKVMMVLAVITFVFFGAERSFAQERTVDATGWLLIPVTTVVPTIDGQLDDIWKCVTAERMDSLEAGGIDTTTSGEPLTGLDLPFAEHFTRFRMLYDEDYLYVFVEIIDDVIDTTSADPWNDDCVELFFDGDNSKNPQATGYDENDVQWRWVYGEASGGPGGCDFAWYDTEEGYNFEVAIPADTLTFTLEGEAEIGFEISNADRDDGGIRERVQHWWTTSGIAWNNPSVFGNAYFLTENDRLVEEYLDIQYTAETPTIDGVMSEDDGWFAENVAELSDNEVEGGAARDTILTTSMDKQSSFRTIWNEDAFYIFVTSYDDSSDTSAADPWNNDCVELFFDGDNSKNPQATGYDENDVQWRWVYGETTGGPGGCDFVWLDTDYGWNLELAIPADSMTFNLQNEQEIGFEVSSADNDGEGREIVRHWWTSSGIAWNNPSVFGNAVLLNPTTAVETPVNVATSYNLSQNFPNPFNPTTEITFSVERGGLVRLNVYNILGKKVKTLYNDIASPGQNYSVRFDGTNFSSGVYFYTLESSRFTEIKKMVIIK